MKGIEEKSWQGLSENDIRKSKGCRPQGTGWKMIVKGVYWPVYSTQMMRKTPIMSML